MGKTGSVRNGKHDSSYTFQNQFQFSFSALLRMTIVPYLMRTCLFRAHFHRIQRMPPGGETSPESENCELLHETVFLVVLKFWGLVLGKPSQYRQGGHYPYRHTEDLSCAAECITKQFCHRCRTPTKSKAARSGHFICVFFNSFLLLVIIPLFRLFQLPAPAN